MIYNIMSSVGVYDFIDNEVFLGDKLRDNKGRIYEVKYIKGYYVLEDTHDPSKHTNIDAIKLGNKIEAIKIQNSC